MGLIDLPSLKVFALLPVNIQKKAGDSKAPALAHLKKSLMSYQVFLNSHASNSVIPPPVVPR
jgi:hypothetical protein